MEKLKLKSFKAFENEIIIPIEQKNLLLYGENGAGKSSLYEAIKIIFFQQRLLSNLSALTPEDLVQLTNEFWSSYNNKINNMNFDIEINDENYTSFVSNNYQVFMISIEELNFGNKLNLKSLLKSFFFSITDVDNICEDFYDLIQDEVNSTLFSFIENVSIRIDKEDDYNIIVRDAGKNIESKLEIRKYFNEAKLNVIVLLVLLTAINISKDSQKSKILVLDDFITSLDSSNRTFVIKYIFENFHDTQLLIFTHNISFYNLIMYVINEINNRSSNWVFANLFEINNSHKLYAKSEIERVKNIKDDFTLLTSPISNVEIESIGNRIRKKFEVLLYEYSKLMMIGTVEDSKKILDRITKGKSAYYQNKNTASDLVDTIQNILVTNNPHNLNQRIQDAIDSYKNDEFSNFQKILKNLKLYQKVTMHPMSHGVSGMSTFTIREISQSIELLEKMENFLKEMVDNDVVTV